MASNGFPGGQDERKYIDDLLNELDPTGRQTIVTVLEGLLSAQGKTFKVREPEQPAAGAQQLPPHDHEGGAEPNPDNICFRIPGGQRYEGLGEGGDVLVLQKTSCTHLRRDKALAGKWIVILRWSQAYFERMTKSRGIMAFHMEWVYPALGRGRRHLLRVEEVGTKYLRGDFFNSDGQRGVYSDGQPVGAVSSVTYDLYTVIEVQPGSDREWQNDPEFMAAVRRLDA
jgi:hypothetical protein